MGAEIVRDPQRALGVVDPRWELWPSESTYDQAAARPGVPVASQDTDAVLLTSGEQTSTIQVRTLHGGYAEPEGASYARRNGLSGDYYGWEVPGAWSAWEPVEWTISTVGRTAPHAVTLASGVVLVASDFVSGGNSKVSVMSRSVGGTWTESSPYSEPTTAGADLLRPCLAVLPSGRVLLHYAVYDDARQTAQVQMAYSDDDGVTWSVGGLYVLPTPLSIATLVLRRIRVCVHGDDLVMVVWTQTTSADLLHQYASTDGGSSYSLIEATIDGGYPDLVSSGAGIVLAYVAGLTNSASRRIAASVRTPFSLDSEEELSSALEVAGTQIGGIFSAGDLAVCRDDDGILYCYVRQVSITGVPGVMVRSVDDGETWDGLGDSAEVSGSTIGVWWQTDDSSTYPTDYSVCVQRGRVVMAHNHASQPGIYDRSLAVGYLGGHTTITLPALDRFYSDLTRQVSWNRTWLPYDLPSDCGWTAGVTGAPTASIATGRLVLTCALGERLVYSRTVVTGAAEGVVCRAVMATTGTASLWIRHDTGTNYSRIKVSLSASLGTLVARDAISLTSLGSVSVTGEVEIEVRIVGTAVAVAWRAHSTGEDRAWTVLVASGTLTTAATLGSSLIEFGTDTAPGAETSTWRSVHYTQGESALYTGTLSGSFPTNPDGLFGRHYSSQPTWAGQGVRLAMVDGPTYRGDVWTIAPRYDYPVEHLQPTVQPSPARGWRSATTTADMRVAWRLATTAEDAQVESNSLGIYLRNSNFRDVAVKTRTAGAWSTLYTASLYRSISFVRRGNAIIPTPTGSAVPGPYIREGELVGSRIRFPNGDIRTISGNRGGFWTAGATVAEQRALISLDGIDGGEDASGTAELWHRDALIVLHLGSTEALEGLALDLRPASVSSPAPAEGYLELGLAALVSLLPLGADPARTRTIERRANTEVVERIDGTRRAIVHGATRRVVDVAWSDLLRMGPVSVDATDDDYLTSTSTGTYPTASRHDTPHLLEGLLERLSGSGQPLLYVPRLERGPPDQYVALLGRQHGAVWGRVESSVRLEPEAVLSDEEVDEMTRIAVISLTEEL